MAGGHIGIATLRRLHLWLTIAWMVMVIPTMLWWRDSIAYVSFMSIYAIIASHAAGWQAARAEDAAS
jgi:hypothetical protein